MRSRTPLVPMVGMKARQPEVHVPEPARKNKPGKRMQEKYTFDEDEIRRATDTMIEKRLCAAGPVMCAKCGECVYGREYVRRKYERGGSA